MVPLMQQGDEKTIFYNNLFFFVLIHQFNFFRLRRDVRSNF